MSESLQAHQEAKGMPGVSGTSDIGVLRGEGLCIRQIGHLGVSKKLAGRRQLRRK